MQDMYFTTSPVGPSFFLITEQQGKVLQPDGNMVNSHLLFVILGSIFSSIEVSQNCFSLLCIPY